MAASAWYLMVLPYHTKRDKSRSAGWGKKGRQQAGLKLPAYSFIPPQVPLAKDWGALWGDWRGKRWPVPARLEFKCAAAARLCGSQAMTGKQGGWHGL
ncbi:hypothetical protein [Nitrosospira multiformis]|uniref:hypothetical protein n=1 Tax=Nitrosospira multiformis TaxID=1231 RepID=UPI0009457562|nr:hypothetical protein [Nitrosospira multiformis]